MTPNALIEIVNVGFQYAGAEKVALKNISLSIQKGEVIAIVGHNGSGKSTLCKMLNALLLPVEGTVTVDGMDTRDEKNLLEIRRRVGMVFQNPDNQLVTTIVEEDVGFGPENLGVKPSEIRARVDEALREVEMTDYAEKASHALSGGQKQRVAIAGLLAGEHFLVFRLAEQRTMVEDLFGGLRHFIHLLPPGPRHTAVQRAQE